MVASATGSAAADVTTAVVRARVPEATAGCGVFYATACASQVLLGRGLGITAASWAAAPVAGVCAATASSVAAGYAAISAGWVAAELTGRGGWRPGVLGHRNYPQSTTAFAAAGLLAFWSLGGEGRMLCPSDLRSHGAYRHVGVPCTSEYADSTMRGRVQMIGRIYGCHSCGVSHPAEAGFWVADHQPPNNTAQGQAREPLRRLVATLSGGRIGGRPAQKFYPHCHECSSWQGTAVRLRRQHLINHLAHVFTRTRIDSQAGFDLRGVLARLKRWHFVGALVGAAAPTLNEWARVADADGGALGWAKVGVQSMTEASRKVEELAAQAELARLKQQAAAALGSPGGGDGAGQRGGGAGEAAKYSNMATLLGLVGVLGLAALQCGAVGGGAGGGGGPPLLLWPGER
jgi:hypothetical protein